MARKQHTVMEQAVRRPQPDWLQLSLAAFMVLLFVIINSTSTGYLRGDGDDDGSGIGGTGRYGPAPETGESGFGGTGLQPFLGNIDSVEPGRLPANSAVAAVRVAVETTTDSGSIDISENIQARLERDALLRQLVLKESSPQIPLREITLETDTSMRAKTRELELGFELPSIAPVVATASIDTSMVAPAVAGINADEQQPARLKRVNLPERVQRPELPPIQRIRPIERLSILPPPVRPMQY
ncbi:MAG: hypothetical protein WDZ76_08145 [Pseudohongiellaceae bacterium]